ncbi:hypothetical protein GGR57DRAFT_312950 [Xylariaceae sp. FL1272]|nr:hypothetical protein GGR57DRAFT_312950 [Xylariaceae sp. FL1272]
MPPIARTTVSSASRGFGICLRARTFATSKSQKTPNRIHNSIIYPSDLHSYQLLSSTSNQPLITLWTASWCRTCHTVSPLLKSMIESGIGEEEGGVQYANVEFDAPDIMGNGSESLPMRYMITSIPTLLSFNGENTGERVMDARKLTDRDFLEDWIRTQARKNGGGGGGGQGGMLGGLFGSLR